MNTVGPRQIDLGNPLADHTFNRGLAGWWLPMPNAAGGATVFDITKGRHNGALTGGPKWAPGPQGSLGSVALDGTDDYIATATGVPSYTTGSYSSTWNIWCRLNAAGSYPMAVTQGATDVLWFGVDTDKKPKYWGGGGGSVQCTTALTLSAWTMLTVTVGGFGGGGVNFYLNGVAVNSGSEYSRDSVSSPQFGRRNDGFYAPVNLASVEYFFGAGEDNKLSAVRVWDLYSEARSGYPNRLRWFTPSPRVFGGTAASPPPPPSGTGVFLPLLGVG